MKAVSFWGLCRLTLLNYVDRMARNVHRHVAATNEIFSPGVGEGLRRKRIAGKLSVTRRTSRLRVEVKAPAREPLAGVGADADD